MKNKNKTVKILAIGDFHGKLPEKIESKLEEADIILLTGDLGRADLARKMAFENIRGEKEGKPEKEYSPQEEKEAFMQSYNSSVKVIEKLSKYATVYIIFGNVEHTTPETKELSRDIGLSLPNLKKELQSMKNVRVINNRIANYKGVGIGGLKYFKDTSWVEEFYPEDEEELEIAKEESKKAKRVLEWFNGLDILLCHQPPYGLLDKVTSKKAPEHWQDKHAGSKVIRDYIEEYQPKYVFCGHIHEAEGERKLGKTNIINLGLRGWKVIEM